MDIEGDTNTKWWQNINLCQPNSNGFCHFDKDDSNSNSLESNNIADTVADDGKDSAATEASATTEAPVTVATTTAKAPLAATTTKAPVAATTTEAPVAVTT